MNIKKTLREIDKARFAEKVTNHFKDTRYVRIVYEHALWVTAGDGYAAFSDFIRFLDQNGGLWRKVQETRGGGLNGAPMLDSWLQERFGELDEETFRAYLKLYWYQ